MNSRAHVEDCLRRIEEKVAGLEKIKDPAARLAARQLFEAVLDLHGLALAKITTRLAMSEEGRESYEALGRDEQVKAVLLLYGLHPESAVDRIQAAIVLLESRLSVRIQLSSVSDGIGRVMLDPGNGDFDVLCQEIGRTLLDVAPDLDDIAIDRVTSPTMALNEAPRAAAAG